MSKKRRNHSSSFKAKVALATLKGDKTISELAEQFDIHPNQIQQWKRKLLDNADEVFNSNKEKNSIDKTDVKQLHAKIGQLTMENDFLSHVLGR